MKRLKENWVKFRTLFIKVFVWVSLIILLPFILLLFCALFLWKYGVLKVIVKFFKPKLISLLNPVDSFYTVSDRFFWEGSRCSIGVILVLNGNVDIDNFREAFTNNILKLEDRNSRRNFAKLTQIPASFGGYYYWQKANYFLIHEHIRQVDQPIDPAGLKKFAGTVMTLPFPNKRPLWEILVFPSYNKECSALVLRFHHAITNPEGVMQILGSLTNGHLQRAVHPFQKTFREKWSFQKVRNWFSIPNALLDLSSHAFRWPYQAPVEIDESIVSWAEINEVYFRKVMKTHTVQLVTVGATCFSGIIAKTLKNSDFDEDINKEEGHETESQVDILLPTLVQSSSPEELLKNDHGITFLDDCWNPSWEGVPVNQLNHIQSRLDNSLNCGCPEISRMLLETLSLLPRHISSILITRYFRGGLYLFEAFASEITSPSDKQGINEPSLDLVFMGEHAVLQMIPLVGLQWTHTGAAGAMLKFQGKITTSLMYNCKLLQRKEPQGFVDEIMLHQFQAEIDKIFYDQRDDQSFASIPII